jgi:hypothetical protein
MKSFSGSTIGINPVYRTGKPAAAAPPNVYRSGKLYSLPDRIKNCQAVLYAPLLKTYNEVPFCASACIFSYMF